MSCFDLHRKYPAACPHAVGLNASSTGTRLLSLSTIADAKISNPPWVNFQSAGWVSFQSAPTIGLFLSQQYSIGTDDLDLIPGTHSSVVTLQEQGWALFVSPAELAPAPTVVVRRTTNDEVLVESNLAVRVLYLEDDKSGDWDPDESSCVTLENTEMWLTRFDVSPTDLGPVLADLEIGITA